MPSAHTVATIYNLALDGISAPPCSGTGDTSRPEVRWLNRNFEHYVRIALRELAPDFATELHEIEAAADTPAFKWSYVYDLPNGWLRVLPPTLYGDRGEVPLPHRVIGNRLYMNEIGPRRVEIIINEQNPGAWDDLFAAVVAARLATGMANRFTHKASIIAATKQAAVEALDAWTETAGYEGSSEPIEQHDILRTRGLD